MINFETMKRTNRIPTVGKKDNVPEVFAISLNVSCAMFYLNVV